MMTVLEATTQITLLGLKTVQNDLAERAGLAGELVRIAVGLVGHDAVIARASALKRNTSSPPPPPESSEEQDP